MFLIAVCVSCMCHCLLCWSHLLWSRVAGPSANPFSPYHRCGAVFFTQPLDLVKNRMQLSGKTADWDPWGRGGEGRGGEGSGGGRGEGWGGGRSGGEGRVGEGR